MRLNRKLLGIVGLLVIGGTGGCGAVTTAKAANSVQTMGASVEVSPNRASPGSSVIVRATCSDKSTTATVTSPAFGTITVAQQSASSAMLTAQVSIANTIQPGTFDVTATCHSGATAMTKLVIVTSASANPTMGPHTGGGFLGGRSDERGPSVPWLAASGATLILAASLGVVSIRRRRRALTVRIAAGPAQPVMATTGPADKGPLQFVEGEPTEIDGSGGDEGFIDLGTLEPAPRDYYNKRSNRRDDKWRRDDNRRDSFSRLDR